MEIIPHVKLKNNSNSHTIYLNLITDITAKIIIMIPQIEKLRNDVELTKLISNCVENSILSKDNDSLDKDEIVLQIIDKIFNLSELEKDQIKSQIIFLKNNKQIKKTSVIKQISKFSINWITKKIL